MEAIINCHHHSTARDHVLGQLPAEAVNSFEEHLLLCEECRSAVGQVEDAVMQLSNSSP